MSPPSLGHFTPVGIGRVPRHLGKRLQPRNSPEREVRITIGAPHSWQISSVGTAGLRLRPSLRVKVHFFFGWFSHATYGPKKPPFTSRRPPSIGQRSRSTSLTSYASRMSESTSTLPSRAWKGP